MEADGTRGPTREGNFENLSAVFLSGLTNEKMG